MSNGTRYKVKVNTVFLAHNEMFYPAHDYWVSPDIYNSTLPDGRKFMDLCVEAQEEKLPGN
jgi:hypothetical protein